jgi:hypothetical protein
MADETRRRLVKGAVYTAPLILTLNAKPTLAKAGSYRLNGNNGIGQEKRGIIDGPSPGLLKKPNQDFNDGGAFAPLGQSGAKKGGRPF